MNLSIDTQNTKNKNKTKQNNVIKYSDLRFSTKLTGNRKQKKRKKKKTECYHKP